MQTTISTSWEGKSTWQAIRKSDARSFFEWTVLAYVVALFFLYPYGIAAGEAANFRVPDVLGMLCVVLGLVLVMLRGRFQIDVRFLCIAGPFLAMELVTPVVGGLAYRQPVDVVSSVRLAMLWLPLLLLAMMSSPVQASRFSGRFTALVSATLVLNASYAILQILADLGFLPSAYLPTIWLEPWAVDRHFDVVEGMRPAGFFVNTTALSAFGIVSLCLFYARFISGRYAQDFGLVLLSLFVIVLTTSRIAVFTSGMIIFAGWLALSAGRKVMMGLALLTAVLFMAYLVEQTVGLEEALARFIRLWELGVLQDVSFAARLHAIWPSAIEASRDFPLGTMVSSTRVIPLIDSGYLTYYIQGRWLFGGTVVLLVLGMVYVGLSGLFRRSDRAAHIMMGFLGVYLAAALVISNPLRSPLIILFLVFVFWQAAVERAKRIAIFRSADTVEGAVK